jgi:hypothetical protein
LLESWCGWVDAEAWVAVNLHKNVSKSHVALKAVGKKFQEDKLGDKMRLK